MKVSDMTRRDIIDIGDGTRLGAVKDMHIDPDTGKVTAIVLENPKKRFGLLRGGPDLVVPWEQIRKIGPDAILVESGLSAEV